jgi:hypothetical protein
MVSLFSIAAESAPETDERNPEKTDARQDRADLEFMVRLGNCRDRYQKNGPDEQQTRPRYDLLLHFLS